MLIVWRDGSQLLTASKSTLSAEAIASGEGGRAATITTIKVADISFALNNAEQIICLKVCGQGVADLGASATSVPRSFCRVPQKRGKLLAQIELNLKSREMLKRTRTSRAARTTRLTFLWLSEEEEAGGDASDVARMTARLEKKAAKVCCGRGAVVLFVCVRVCVCAACDCMLCDLLLRASSRRSWRLWTR